VDDELDTFGFVDADLEHPPGGVGAALPRSPIHDHQLILTPMSEKGDRRVLGRPHRPDHRVDLEEVDRVARHKRISPHSLRHSLITAALDAGVPLRDVQEAASHADPRTTMRYDRGRGSLDRHATYIVTTFVAGASR